MKAESHYSSHQRLDVYLNMHKSLGLAKHPSVKTPRTREQQLETFNAAYLKRERRNARRVALATR
jgi:hypothetical protein